MQRQKSSTDYYLFCTNLNKFGIKIVAVDVSIWGGDTGSSQMVLKSDKESTGIQLFWKELFHKKSETDFRIVEFRIHIIGSLPEYCYQYQLSDQLLKKNLLQAAQQQQMTDLEFVTSDGNKLFAHKGILAARSPVLASQFSASSSNGFETIRMENVESITLSYTFFEAKEGAHLIKPPYVK